MPTSSAVMRENEDEMIQPDEIRNASLFKGLSPDQVVSVLGIAQEKSFLGGDTVVRQFERATDILIILEGAVRIKGFQGEDLAELPAGAVVGEVAMVDQGPRSATVIASGRCRAAFIPAADLGRLMAGDAEMKATLMENLAKVLASRLRSSSTQLDSALSQQH